MKLNLHRTNFGSLVLLVLLIVCSTTFANEHNRIASKIMKTQSCFFNITRFNLTDDNVQKLLSQQVETLRIVNHITHSTMNRLVQENPSFRSLANNLTLGLRFGSLSNISYRSRHRPEEIQLGYGRLNYRKSIRTTGDVLERLGIALNTVAYKWLKEPKRLSILSIEKLFQSKRQQQLTRSKQLNQISNSLLTRTLRVDLQNAPSFRPIAITVLNSGFRFGVDAQGSGRFNRGKNVRDSSMELRRLAGGLLGIADRWKTQLGQQKRNCERYLQDTFARFNKVANSTRAVLQNSQANLTTSTAAPLDFEQFVKLVLAHYNKTETSSTVSPASKLDLSIDANLANIAQQLNITQSQLVTQLLSTYNGTSSTPGSFN